MHSSVQSIGSLTLRALQNSEVRVKLIMENIKDDLIRPLCLFHLMIYASSDNAIHTTKDENIRGSNSFQTLSHNNSFIAKKVRLQISRGVKDLCLREISSNEIKFISLLNRLILVLMMCIIKVLQD